MPKRSSVTPRRSLERSRYDEYGLVARRTLCRKPEGSFAYIWGCMMRKQVHQSPEDRQAVVTILNSLLADEFMLYTKTRNFHWNVVGPSFMEMHRLLDEQYQMLNLTVDDVAEQVRSVGGVAIGTLVEMKQQTRLQEFPGHLPEALKMLEALMNDHEQVSETLHDAIDQCQEHHDPGSENLLQEILMKHQKTAWVLRSYLQTVPTAVLKRRAAQPHQDAARRR